MSPTRRIDTAAWADVLADMLASAGMTQTELARRMGLSRKSVQRWLKRETSVTADNVRDAAGILGRDPQRVLSEVGFLPADDEPESESPPIELNDDVERELWGMRTLTAPRKLQLIFAYRARLDEERAARETQRRIG